MKKTRATKGSALLLAVIVVLLAAGVGGSFLIVNLTNARTQQTISDQDELMAMCDAGVERAKQALDIYRGYIPSPTYVKPAGAKDWSWDEILQYCDNNLAVKPTNYWDPPDMHAIMEDALKAMDDPTSPFNSYASKVSWDAAGTKWGGVNTKSAELSVPSSTVKPTAGDWLVTGTFFGWNIPYHRGAIHIYIHNNGGKLTDALGNTLVWDTLTGELAEDFQYKERDNTICITVTATLRSGAKAANHKMGGLVRQVQCQLKRPPPPPPTAGPKLAAVTSNDDVDLLGTVSIDGRDWDETGTTVVKDGVYGVVSTKDVNVKASSAVGGPKMADKPPGKGATAGSTLANGTSYITANYPSGYPKTPDEVMKANAGDLKAAAIASGTYFTSESAYNAAMPAGGWSDKIVYVDFDPTPSFSIGNSSLYNDKPSIMIIHNDAGTTSVKNTKGFFKGLIIADEINHTSAPGGWLGAAFMLSPTASSGANAFGTGNTPIKYSSAVLDNLPKTINNNTIPSTVVSYRKIQ